MRHRHPARTTVRSPAHQRSGGLHLLQELPAPMPMLLQMAHPLQGLPKTTPMLPQVGLMLPLRGLPPKGSLTMP